MKIQVHIIAIKSLVLKNETYKTILIWAELDLNQRRRKPADLQSAPFNPSGTDPNNYFA